jgi:predicted dehydrogenase
LWRYENASFAAKNLLAGRVIRVATSTFKGLRNMNNKNQKQNAANENAVSRRRFLVGAAATFSTPYIITSAALGQPGSGKVAANSRITMGQIGIGNQGSGLLGGFAGNRNVQMIAVSDVKPQILEPAFKRIGSPAGGAHKDFRELLARPDIDAVVLATPDHWHALMTIEAAKNGKDIYCEKPLSLTIAEARAMVNAVRRYGRVFQTGSMQRSGGEFQAAVNAVRNGNIGAVQKIQVGLPNRGQTALEYGLSRPPETEPPPGFDYDMWLGPAPWRPYNPERVSGNYGGGWRYYRDYSGGMMTDWGAHHFDIAQWALNMDNSGPVEVYPPGWEGYPQLTYKYPNGVPMTMETQMFNGLRITGENGVVEVERGRVTPDWRREKWAPQQINVNRGRGHSEDWIECIRTRELPICDVEVGARSATVCHLGNIARWLNRPIKWDPVKEEIVGDPDAARWLSRPYRAPWHLDF